MVPGYFFTAKDGRTTLLRVQSLSETKKGKEYVAFLIRSLPTFFSLFVLAPIFIPFLDPTTIGAHVGLRFGGLGGFLMKVRTLLQ